MVSLKSGHTDLSGVARVLVRPRLTCLAFLDMFFGVKILGCRLLGLILALTFHPSLTWLLKNSFAVSKDT